MKSPNSVTVSFWQTSQKGFGRAVLSSLGARQVAFQVDSAKAAQRAGGYSFRCAVRNCPLSSLPMLVALGLSSVMCHFRRVWIRSGELAARSVVGLRLEAPKRPWANSTFCTLGMLSKRRIIGNFQIEGACSLSGSAGCSSRPWRVIMVRAKIASMQKLSRMLPSKTASSSRSAKEGKPQSSSADRTGLGAR